MLIVMTGLPATGKTRLAGHLARALSGIVLSPDDAIRAARLPADQIASRAEQHDEDVCLSILLATASSLLQEDPAARVLLDAPPILRGDQFRAVERTAAAVGTSLMVIACVCAQETIRRRLLAQAGRRPHPAPTWSQERLASCASMRAPNLVLNTDSSIARCLVLALTCIWEVSDRDLQHAARACMSLPARDPASRAHVLPGLASYDVVARRARVAVCHAGRLFSLTGERFSPDVTQGGVYASSHPFPGRSRSPGHDAR